MLFMVSHAQEHVKMAHLGRYTASVFGRHLKLAFGPYLAAAIAVVFVGLSLTGNFAR